MATVPHPQPSEQFRRTVADLDGDRDTSPTAATPPTWPQAVAQVSTQLCEKLRLDVPTARLQKALELVLAHAVTLHEGGSTSVQSGKETYTLAPHCPCPDAKNRAELCTHALAVELHRRALALLDGTAHASAPAVTGAPLDSVVTPVAASAVVVPAPVVPTSAAWNVQEAPTSACFKWRLGQGELLYTFRGVDDAEVLERIRTQLPLLHDILEACESRAAERAAARVAAEASRPPLADTTHPLTTADVSELLRQAAQQLHAESAVHATPPPRTGPAKRPATSRDQETGVCSLHTIDMDFHDNERGTWYSHLLDNGRYCKGAR